MGKRAMTRPEVRFGACPVDRGALVRRYGEPGVVFRCVNCDYRLVTAPARGSARIVLARAA